MSFAEVLKQVKSLSYEVIIFDTAPTGHTLRFLQFPTVLEKALAKLSQLSTQFGPMLNSMLGARGGLPGGQNLDEMVAKMETLRETISEVNTQFKNADMTTFVCVCIAEFLSLYETERMIQELASYEIDTHSIVVNQLLFPKKNNDCVQCQARRKMQKKYLDQIEELYEDFNVVRMPMLVEEVRGKERLEEYVEPLDSGPVPTSTYDAVPANYDCLLGFLRCLYNLTSLRNEAASPRQIIVVYSSSEQWTRAKHALVRE